MSVSTEPAPSADWIGNLVEQLRPALIEFATERIKAKWPKKPVKLSAHRAKRKPQKFQQTRKFTSDELATVARERCLRQQRYGRPANYEKTLRTLQAGRSALTPLDLAVVAEHRTATVENKLDEVEASVTYLERYRHKRFSESDSEFDARTSREAQDFCLAQRQLGKDFSFAEVLDALRHGQRPESPSRYQRRKGETPDEHAQRTSDLAMERVIRARERGQEADFATELAKIRGK